MQNKIAVTVIEADDLRAAPSWVQEYLEACSQGAAFELNVYTEIKAGVLMQHVDVVVGDSVMGTGAMLPLVRHLSKGGLAAVGRAAAMDHNLALGIHPCLLSPTPTTEVVSLWDSGLAFAHELAWMMDIPVEEVPKLHALDPNDRLKTCRELVPGVDGRWKAAYEQGLQAVAFL